MPKGKGCRALIMASAVIAGTTAEIRAGNDPASIIVQIQNYAGVPPRTLATAKAEVEEVFRAAGVLVAWQQMPAPGGRGAPRHGEDSHRFTLLVVNVETAVGNPRSSMLGLAVRPRGHAFVFYNRVLELAAARPIDAGLILGRVMAHEIGHLLLPPGQHAHHGLMRGDIDVDFTNPSRFTREEAQKIARRLWPVRR